MTFDQHVCRFLKNLQITFNVPCGVEVMNPYANGYTLSLCEQFYSKFYHDLQPRTFIFGINPGRFGGGITGIPFTDPLRLEDPCGIRNTFPKKAELSSLFIYDMIDAAGGTAHFYSQHYITAISPLGFTREGKNLNYYDDKSLEIAIEQFVVSMIEQQLLFGTKRDKAFCIGEGKNFKYLARLNEKKKYFQTIIPLPHPRFIMQYRLKKKAEYIGQYLQQLGLND